MFGASSAHLQDDIVVYKLLVYNYVLLRKST